MNKATVSRVRELGKPLLLLLAHQSVGNRAAATHSRAKHNRLLIFRSVRSGLGGLAILLACIAAITGQEPKHKSKRVEVNSRSPKWRPLGNNQLVKQLQARLDEWAGVAGHQGVSAAVILADGTEWTGVAGRDGSGSPLTSDHLISIASITKTMTAAVILQLADENRLSLDDPVSRWLKPRANVRGDITIRQLLNHTNGLDNYSATDGLRQAIAADPMHIFTADELLSFLRPPQFDPGTRTQYTNTSFVLLGQVAERVAGRPILSLYRRRLWRPLRLTEIFLPGHEAAPGPVASVLSGSSIVEPLSHPARLSVGNAAFGLFANARSVARWGHSLYSKNVISPRMQQEMRTTVGAAGNIPGETGSGLGLRGYGYLGRNQIGHSGGSPFGSSLLLYDVATCTTVVVVMNQASGADHFVLAPELLRVTLDKK